MNTHTLLKRAMVLEHLSLQEGLYLYEQAKTTELMFAGNQIRQRLKPGKEVGWIIDRNVNTTNACVSSCKFCNFYTKPNADNVYVTTLDQYKEKIEVLKDFGGDQLLLQGGHHPKLDISYYTTLFKALKNLYPEIKLHALGPPEIAHISRISKLSFTETLKRLTEAGLDSLPGAGAEILSDEIRKKLSPGKCSTQDWLNVMREAHKQNITTSATMMIGTIETHEDRIQHLISLRQVQSEKPEGSEGFTTFIPWPFMDKDTELSKMGVNSTVTAEEYIRTVAISRIMMPNIKNLQASWLTVGKEIGQLCLHAGANDFGSIMIEENVVSAAGANHSFSAKGIQAAIADAGYTPRRRNQKYEYVYD